MFGMGNNDDEERFWNFILFKFYGTDKEFEGSAPWILIGVVVVGILALIFLS
jgi:hypothetical protein